MSILLSPAGRRFRFRATALADAAGSARLRVPYASEPGAATGAEGRWRVRGAGAEREVAVSERDVVEGRVLRLPSLGARDAP